MSERYGRGTRLRKHPRVSHIESVEEDVDEGEERVREVEGDEDVELHHRKVAKMTPTKPTRAKERECFRFFDLPGEIRNEIYKFTLISPHCVCFERPVVAGRRMIYRNRWQQVFDPLEVNVIYLNKATFAEAAPFLYKNNFHFSYSTEMLQFLSGLSPMTKTWIEKISLGIDMTPRHISGNLSPDSLNDLASLRGLSLVSYMYGEYSNHRIAQEFYSVAHDWLGIIGREKGYKAAGVDLICLRGRFNRSALGVHTSARAEGILSELKKIIMMDNA